MGPLFGDFGGNPEITGMPHQLVKNIEIAVQGFVLTANAQDLAGLFGFGENIKSVYEYFAGGGRVETRNTLDGGGFAGPIGPQKAETFARVNVKRNTRKGLNIITAPAGTVTLGELNHL